MSERKPENINRDAKYVIISDAHIGTRGPADCCNYDKLIPFLKELLHQTRAILIINGDFFEFMKNIRSRVLKNNEEIIEILSKLKNQERLIQIRGNHDRIREGKKEICLNDSILVTHGDIFEKTTSVFSFMNFFVHVGVSFVEKLFGMNINDIMRKFLGYDRMKCRGKKMEQKAIEYLEKHPKYKAIIVGHSHTPTSNGKYFNSGCFTGKNSDYIEVTPDDNIKLKKY